MQRRISLNGLFTVAAILSIGFIFVIGSPSISSGQGFNVHVDGIFAPPYSLYLYGWPPGSSLTLTFDNPVTAQASDCTITDLSFPSSGEPIGVELTGLCDGVTAGWSVIVTDGTNTKEHTVMNVRVTEVDYDSDIVRGTADPGSHVYVQNHQGYLPTIEVDADGGGNWEANYWTEWDFDLTYCHGGEAWQMDEDFDSTQFSWFPAVWCGIEDIVTIFNEWVEAGDLVGPGTKGAVEKLLELSYQFYQAGNINTACQLLNTIYLMCDGEPKPTKDVVRGDAQEELASIIRMVYDVGLSCE
jgi:hypothetical protein